MLRVDLAALGDGPIEVDGTIAPTEPLFADVEFRLATPIRVVGRLIDSGPGQYFWRGRLEANVELQCGRCLEDIALSLRHAVEALFTDDAAIDDPVAYVIPRRATAIEMDEMVREQLILAVPNFPVCRPDCRGLCARCGSDLNQGPCDCPPDVDPRWAGLQALGVPRDPKEK